MTLQLVQPPTFRVGSVLVRPPGLAVVSPRTDPGHHDHIVQVHVVGELDIATAPALTTELIAAGRGHAVWASWATVPAIELDLSGLAFLDSSGVGALVAARIALNAMGCGLCLTFPRPQVLRLLDCAVCNGWLPPDVECAGYHPWAPASPPITGGAAMFRHRVAHRTGRAPVDAAVSREP